MVARGGTCNQGRREDKGAAEAALVHIRERSNTTSLSLSCVMRPFNEEDLFSRLVVVPRALASVYPLALGAVAFSRGGLFVCAQAGEEAAV